MDVLINQLDTWLAEIVELLPASPFTTIEHLVSEEWSQALGIINYFVNITAMLYIGGLWLVSVAGYLLISAVLRWVKAVS